MSLWWMFGGGTSLVDGANEVNAPSLWSGGVTWEAEDAGTGTQGYWQTSRYATPRTGLPELSVAIGGTSVTHLIRRASWSLGREQWLSTLSPSSASLAIEGAATFEVGDEVVIAVLSEVTTEHSDPLWVGYVDNIDRTTETSGHVTTNATCIDIVGLLGQADVPSSVAQGSLAEVVEALALASGLVIEVEDQTGGVSGLQVGASSGNTGTVLGYVNQAEQAVNGMLVMRGNGRLVVVHRMALESLPDPVALTGSDAPSTWTVQLSPTSVVNDWPHVGGVIPGQAAEIAVSKRRYGTRSFEPDQGLALDDHWIDVWASGVLLAPRPLLTSADFPVTDLAQVALFVDPLDMVTLDGETYQVMSVAHSVEPGHRWTVTITGDITQNALVGE